MNIWLKEGCKMSNGKILFINCSPRGKKSNSNLILGDILKKIDPRNLKTQMIHLINIMQKPETLNEWSAKISLYSTVIFLTPLYIDSLPARLIVFLDEVKKVFHKETPRIFTIVNSGFPETRHSRNAIQQIKFFTLNAGFINGGYLIVGGGEMLNGRENDEITGPGMFVKKYNKKIDEMIEFLEREQLYESEIQILPQIFLNSKFLRYVMLRMSKKSYQAGLDKMGLNKDVNFRPY